MEVLFPPISPFQELIERAKRNPMKTILRDHATGVAGTAGQLLHSVSTFGEELRAALAQNGVTGDLSSLEGRFIFLIAPPGWEYVVSMLTIFSLGAAMSAQSIIVRPEEIIDFIKISDPVALLYAPALSDKAEATKVLWEQENKESKQKLPFVKIQTSYPNGTVPQTYKVDSVAQIDPAQPGSLFFTSGTSGKKKGVVHSYQALLASAKERIGTWKLTEKDVVLNQKPANWMGGIFGIIPSLISGACLETCAGIFTPEWFWERIKQGGVSVFDVAPTGYDRLAQYFEENIAPLQSSEKEAYIREIIAARVAGVSGSLLPPHTQKKWTKLRRGKPLLNLYGSTEVTLMCSMRWERPEYPDMCSIGPPVPGVEVKLIDGEMRLKAPTMFSHYLSDDPTQTEKAFDEEGFFKSGDCAEKIGDSYKLLGRANIDVLHFWGFTLHTGEIESALFSLPYVSNAIVFPIEDREYQERAAAIIQLEASFKSQPPGLHKLRNDLNETGLLLFKQPTVVYWLQDGEEISLTANGKVSKIDARKRFFGHGWRCSKSVEVLDLKGIEYWRMGGQC